MQYIEQYDGGGRRVRRRARELAARYGDRFVVPASLVERPRGSQSTERRHDQPVSDAADGLDVDRVGGEQESKSRAVRLAGPWAVAASRRPGRSSSAPWRMTVGGR